MVSYGREIAKASLSIGGIKLWKPEHHEKDGTKPFLWASGFYMPIYNDNRMLLGNYDHRMLVRNAWRDTMQAEHLKADMIAGTVTAGIAPSSSLAQHLGLPLVIYDKGQHYVFEPDAIEDMVSQTAVPDDANIIFSTCPFAIPFGVAIANQRKLPFAYVRQKHKGHGLMNQIEGIVEEGQKAFLIDIHLGKSYGNKAIEAIIEKGAYMTKSGSTAEGIFVSETKLSQPSLAGLTLTHGEDLVSTGGSCIKEIQAYRDMGATITDVLAIFNYGLEKAMKQFNDADLHLHAALTYKILLEEALESEAINEKDMEILTPWQGAPFDWGENNGFPPVEKK